MNVLLILALTLAVVSAKVPSIKLNSGYEMPQLGLGTWQATGDPVIQAVKDALSIGYRHIDTAEIYHNEHEVGVGIHAQLSAGIFKREDLFITTKVWPTTSNRQKALQTVRQSLKNLNVTYLDLVLIHAPEGPYTDIWKGLEDAVDQKLVRSIGISNFDHRDNIDHIVKSAKIKPAVNQIKVHPTINQDDTIAFCNELGIAITGYSPLGTGKLLQNPTLIAIGKKHNKSAAQVALRWQIDRHLITIPKSVNKKYIQEDFNIFDFELTKDEMNTIHNMH